MKKIKSLLFLILIIITSTFLFSCSGTVKKLELISLVSGKNYLFNIETNTIISGGDFKTFTTELTLADIKTCITNQGYSCQVYNNNYLLISKAINETKKDYFIIAKLADDKNYQLMSAVAYDEESGDYTFFPIHLIAKTSSDLKNGEIYSFETGVDYEINYDKKTVKDFYLNTGLFLISDKESKIDITLINTEFTYKLLTNNFSIIFREDGNKLYISIQIER